jgi:hypothetical protein
MSLVVAHIKAIMLVSGLLTCTMLLAAVAPQAALRSTFGETLEGPVADMVVRNWGALIGLMGVMLIYGAFVPAVRPLALTVAGISKLVFMGLIAAHGQPFLSRAAVPVAADLVMVALYAAYLGAARRGSPGP